MSKSHLNNFTIIILSCLFMRHYFFYFGENLNTEFGYDQPFLALLLTPITGMMCAAVFWKNDKTVVLNFVTWLLILFAICIGVIYSYHLEILDKYFVYDIYDHSRRPPFYVLFPIAAFFAIKEPSRTVIFYMATLAYLYDQNFILHYFILFYLSSRIYPNIGERLDKLAVIIWFCVLASIYLFQIERVNILIEFLWITSSLVIVDRVARFAKLMGIRINLRPKIIVFYLIQAAFFTIATRFLTELSIWYLCGCLLICILVTVVFTRVLEGCIGWLGGNG